MYIEHDYVDGACITDLKVFYFGKATYQISRDGDYRNEYTRKKNHRDLELQLLFPQVDNVEWMTK